MAAGASCFDWLPCLLGEGPFWHPERNALFWFDILSNRMICRTGAERRTWSFDAPVSAAGWVDRDRLVIAGQRGLSLFDLEAQTSRVLAEFPQDAVPTRSNDGRADPWGGMWISTMGFTGEPGAGAIYRFIGGRLTRLFDRLSIPNAICFASDRRHAYFTDTTTRRVMRVALDADGWPSGKPFVHIDLNDDELNPDGAVVDADGCLWIALWGGSTVARYAPDGTRIGGIAVPAAQATCPAFGGPELRQLFVTSATVDLENPGPADGQTFVASPSVAGQAEHRLRLDP